MACYMAHCKQLFRNTGICGEELLPARAVADAFQTSGRVSSGGERLLFTINLGGGWQRGVPMPVCMPVPSPAVLGLGTAEQPAGDMAFALLLPSTQGCLLHMSFLVQGTGYRFAAAQHKQVYLSTVPFLTIINEHYFFPSKALQKPWFSQTCQQRSVGKNVSSFFWGYKWTSLSHRQHVN